MILLFGPVGAGKSVQGELLAERFGWKWLSTGQMFRASEDEEVKKILASGELMDDQTTFGVVQEAFQKEKDANRVILDGFPRTMPQAQWLLSEESRLGREVAIVVALDVSDDVIIERLAGRGRAEDAPDKIKRRMEIYREQTNPILEYFSEHGVKLAHIDGDGGIEMIHERIVAALKSAEIVS
ncbi:MAG TPA: nucleoside monophosphate kinase [Candidatus Saccharimonadales bacterium]